MAGCTIINGNTIEDESQTTCSSTPPISTPCGAAMEALALLEPAPAVQDTTTVISKTHKESII